MAFAYRTGKRISAWGMFGYRGGELSLALDDSEAAWTTDTSMGLAVGGRARCRCAATAVWHSRRAWTRA